MRHNLSLNSVAKLLAGGDFPGRSYTLSGTPRQASFDCATPNGAPTARKNTPGKFTGTNGPGKFTGTNGPVSLPLATNKGEDL